MLEKAQDILDFLPIRRSEAEDEYINHLWESFLILDSGNKFVRPFLMMPFHLLFMFAIQSKVMRIYKERKKDYGLSFTIVNLRNDQRDVLSPTSPFTVALLNESQIIDFFKLIGLSAADIKKTKALIRNRNDNLAHAKGGIERSPDLKIEEYIDVLNEIQKKLEVFNNSLATKWLSEINNEDNINDFVESNLLSVGFCRRDFASSKLSIFPALSSQLSDGIGVALDGLARDEWLTIYSEGLVAVPNQAREALKYVAEFDYGQEKRFSAIKTLHDGNFLENAFIMKLLEKEKDDEIINFLTSKASNS